MSEDIKSAVAGAAATAVAGGFLEWVRRRKRPRVEQADVASSISSAFQLLVDELQKDNARHLGQIRELRTEATRMQTQLTRLKTYAFALFRHVDALEAQLRDLGVTPSPRPDFPDALTVN